MGIEARFTEVLDKPPVIAYVHTGGLSEVYGSVIVAREHLLEVLEDQYSQSYLWMIAIIWGNAKTKDKMIDFFGYNDIGERWPGNPTVYSWVTRNGIVQPRNRDEHGDATCGEGLILLGAEEIRRKKTQSLEGYINTTQVYSDHLRPRI